MPVLGLWNMEASRHHLAQTCFINGVFPASMEKNRAAELLVLLVGDTVACTIAVAVNSSSRGYDVTRMYGCPWVWLAKLCMNTDSFLG